MYILDIALAIMMGGLGIGFGAVLVALAYSIYKDSKK